MAAILTTGTKSGLGRYIYEQMGGIELNRLTLEEEKEKIGKRHVDALVHCAFSSRQNGRHESPQQYFRDNLIMTGELISFRYNKFIFISSVDVYPKDGKLHSEEEVIDANAVSELYGITKLAAESLVKNHCPDYLILRPAALLGKYSRKNSLIKIIEDKDIALTLSGNSRFNYVLHSHVLEFIKLAMAQDLKGIYNIASSANITLSETAGMLGKQVRFGTYFYDAGNINSGKAASLLPAFKKTSQEVIRQFIDEKKR